jgi:PAS domain S-box-containing protein
VGAVRGCGLALLDGEGRIGLWSPGAEVILGRRATDVIDRTAEVLLPPGARDGWPAAVLEAVCRHGIHEEERWLARADGSLVRAALTWTVEESGPSTAFALVLHDVTTRWRREVEREAQLGREEQARRRAEQAMRAREEFLATLSHELRTPLTAIVGWAHLLRSGTLDAENRERAVEIIERNARVEAQLTADILDVSRVIAGKLRLSMQKVDPAAVVRAALDTVVQDAQRKGVGLEVDLQPAGPVRGDPGRLQQAVGNLLANAVKFTPSGGRVQVSLRGGERAVEVQVRDTGAGIPEDVLPHIFDRFGQGTRRWAGGLGLGLVLCRHLIELHAGTLSASSPGPGRGAIFSFTLPRTDGEVER